MKQLKPTIWRTVRALLNADRLNLMRLAFAHGGDWCVSDFARALGREEPVVSIYLRHLNSRGLLGVRRGAIKVYYDTSRDRTLPDSVLLQDCLRDVLEGAHEAGWEKPVLAALKAFSHPNRLAMLVRLADGPATLADLGRAAGRTVKSVYHHLRFLHAAGLVEETTVWRGETTVRLVAPSHPLARTLLRIVLNDQKKFKRYWNPPPAKKTDAAERKVLRRIDAAEGNDGPDCWKRAPRTHSVHPLSAAARRAMSET